MESDREGRGKTDAVRQFFDANAGRVFTPTEIATELKIPAQIATAIINRMATEGWLKKVDRGRFFREPSITAKDLRTAHDAVVRVVESLIGRDVATSMMGAQVFKFEDAKGVETLSTLLGGVQKVFGKEYADRLVQHALASALPDRWKPLIELVNAGGSVRK
ncbi:MAG TPA: hypothetical protein VI893_11035 [Thermoplasmata archaeon]|nr:hypothetical protein [Thermoplasmata archaeon]